jgi:hypothetical protein
MEFPVAGASRLAATLGGAAAPGGVVPPCGAACAAKAPQGAIKADRVARTAIMRMAVPSMVIFGT